MQPAPQTTVPVKPSQPKAKGRHFPIYATVVTVLLAASIAGNILLWMQASQLPGLTKFKMRSNPAQTGNQPVPQGMEFSATLMKNFPERVQAASGGLEGKVGWMDATLGEINNDEFDHFNEHDPSGQLDSSKSVGLTITDKNSEMFDLCYADKSKWGDFLLRLKYGDKIRLIGQAMMFLRNGTDADFEPWFRIDSIQVIN